MKLINFFTDFVHQHPYTAAPGIAALSIIAAWFIYEIRNPFEPEEYGEIISKRKV
jgi:hypothetical protein